MRTNNKMKDFEAKSDEWLEVAKGIFYKGVGEEFGST
jgi:hypothetical protein